jgi:hypothetical protein
MPTIARGKPAAASLVDTVYRGMYAKLRQPLRSGGSP